MQVSRLGRLGCSPGPPGPLAQAAWDAEVDRKDRPIGSEAPFSMVLGGSGGRFSWFSEVTSRERVDSQGEELNLCFCWQAQYFRGFAVFLRKPKVDGNRRKFASKTLLANAAREILDSFASRRALESILAASACCRTLLGALSGVPGRLCGLPGRSRGAPRTPRDAPETFPRSVRDALGCPGAS